MVQRLLVILCLLQTQGCCGLFALFGCGTGTPLVPVSWDSPERALRTFLAAVAASDTKVIYESLAEDFKAANGIDGLGLAVAWKRLQDKVPGIHLAGTAAVVAAEGGRDRRTYHLAVLGHRFTVELGARPYWDLGLAGADGKVHALGEFVDSLNDVLVTADKDRGRLLLRIDDPAIVDAAPEDIAFVKAGIAWKITLLRREEPPSGS